jgi:hypothetical protein
MTHRTVIRLFSSVLLAGLILGCGDDNPSAPAGPFLRVTDPGFFGLLEGSTQQLDATIDGVPATVTWSSSNTAVITVTPAGLVTAVGAGNAAATAALSSDPTVLSSASFTVTSPPTLVSGTAVTAVSGTGARGTQRLWKIIVPAGAASLSITLAGGTGDVDLYMQQGTPPDIASYDVTSTTCSSENGGNGESCTIPSPAAGTWFVMLALWDPYAGVTLTPVITP